MEEKVLKEASSLKDDYRVVQKGDIIESINKLNHVFHIIDLSYLKKGILYHAWNGFRTTEQLKGVLDGHFIDVFKKYRLQYALVDSTRMCGSFNDANEWLANNYMPRLTKLGLLKVAVVLPHNIFAQMAVDEWDKKVEGFQSRNFGTVTEAVTWLLS